jgi:hypothetical protein
MQGAGPLHATPKYHVSLLSRGRFPEGGPRTGTPPTCVFCSPTLFSACSQHTGSPACVWCVCRPLALFSAIAHSIASIIGRLSVFTCFPCVPFTDAFQRLLPVPRSAPSGLVQRTGCGACGLGYPHQFWWAPPMYIARSWLFPVSFAGFLIKCTPRWASTAISRNRRGIAPVIYAWPIV